MRLSALAIMAPLFSLCVTTILAVDTTAPITTTTTTTTSKEKDSKKSTSRSPTTLEQEHVATGKLSSLAVHKFPVIWNFEVDNDFAETPQMLAQMEEAFLLSANEVHNTADIKFLSATIKSSMHEHLTDETDNKKKRKKKTMMMMMLNGDEEDDEQLDSYDDSDEETMDTAAAADPTGDGATRALRRSIWNRPANRKFGESFRPNYTSNGSIGCNLCSNDDDDATAMLAHPLEQGSAFYLQLEEGREIRAQWQRKFCQKLRGIPSLHTARRCFIYLDLDHEEPDDTFEEVAAAAAAAVSTFPLADI